MSPASAGIDLRHLRYFLAVYEELHFGRAAERLHIAQPPLSQAIRKLEQELGVQLFLRTSRAVEATPAGRVLAEEARRVLASFDFAVTETRQVGCGSSPLKIGCLLWLPTVRLQHFIAELKKRDQSLRTEVTHLLGRDQVERLRSGQLDLGVLWHPEDYPELEYSPLFPGGAIGVALPSEHRLANKEVLTPDDLATETLIMFPRSSNPAFFEKLEAMLHGAGYTFSGVHETSTDPRDMLLAVEGGLGVALTPTFVEELGEGRSLVYRPLDPEILLPDLIVAWRANAPRRLRSLLTAVRESAAVLYEAAGKADRAASTSSVRTS
jgi:DNA-binding transcriptional LysR family regulator